MRAHREIDIDMSWINGYDPRERWWTVEVDFPTALDEIFGVTNNKQGAMTFQRLSGFDWKRLALPGEDSPGEVRRRLEEDGDPGVLLWEVRRQILNAIKLMRRHIKHSGKKRGDRHKMDELAKADAKATAAIIRRVDEDNMGISDKKAQSGTPQQNQEAQIQSLVKRHHFDEPYARQIVEMSGNNKVRWIVSAQPSPAFFDVESLPDVIQVALNEDHPVYSHLYELFASDIDGMSEDELRERLTKATAAFHILIYAWARYEDEQTDKAKRTVRKSRLEWGEYAEEFFEEDANISRTDGLL